MRRAIPIVLGAAAIAGLLVAVWPGGGPAPSTVSVSLTPRAPLFGDQVVAEISAPRRARVQASFSPYRIRSASLHGGVHTYRLECLTAACAPGPKGVRVVRLPGAVVRVGVLPPVRISWPPLRVGSRLSPADVKQPTFRADLAPPRRSSSLDPDTLGWGLTSGAGVLLLGAAGWGARRMRSRPTLHLVADPDPEPSELERALAGLDRSLNAPPERRRVALDRLALALGDRPLARRARTLAWSPEAPAPPAMSSIAREAREFVA